jgi:hypothetical protein
MNRIKKRMANKPAQSNAPTETRANSFTKPFQPLALSLSPSAKALCDGGSLRLSSPETGAVIAGRIGRWKNSLTYHFRKGQGSAGRRAYYEAGAGAGWSFMR